MRLQPLIVLEFVARDPGIEAASDDLYSVAQRRRYRKLARAGKPPTVVTTAIARELAGFVWAIANQVESSGALIRRS